LTWRNAACLSLADACRNIRQEASMLAGEVMSPGVLTVSLDASIYDAAELMVSAEVSALPVTDSRGHLAGIVSEADLMRRTEIGTEPHKGWLARVFADGLGAAAEYVTLHSRRVRDVMTKDVVMVREDAPLAEVADLMAKHKIKRVPVVRANKVVGILSRANLVRALLSRDPELPGERPSDEALRRTVEAAVRGQAWTSPWPVNILVSAGVVHLWGFVGSDSAMTAYRVAAENVPGVRKVKSHLRHMPSAVLLGA
jgi:CBS domain-containing protein